MISTRERVRLALREGGTFEDVFAEISRSQWLDHSKLRELQEKKVVAVVRHAAQRVPFYRRFFAERGWEAVDFTCLEDIKKLPWLTKQDILRDPREFITDNARGLRFSISTSGTTGTPLTIFQDLTAIIRENAFIARHLGWAAFERGQRRAWIRGDLIVPIQRRRPPFWRQNRAANMLMFSSYHLSDTNAPAYLDALESFNPTLIQAYPSSVGFLARVLENSGGYFLGRSLKAVMTSSETLSAEQRSVIESRFRCPVFDHYGSSERVVMAGTCEKGAYHIESDYGFCELESCADGTFEIIGTGFNNWLMPLIRYKTGDRVTVPIAVQKCDCGREMPIISRVEGRKDDYVITRDGRHIGRLDHIYKGVGNIVEAQIRQDSVGEVRILVVPGKRFSERDSRTIVDNARQRIGREMAIRLEQVDNIPRGQNGKFISVVCNLPG